MNTKVFYGLSMVVSAFVLFCISYTVIDITQSKLTNNISLPEEISEAKKGDILVVEEASDSIYLGFKHKNDYQYSLDLIDQNTVKLKSNIDDNIYITTPDSLLYYIDRDNN